VITGHISTTMSGPTAVNGKLRNTMKLTHAIWVACLLTSGVLTASGQTKEVLKMGDLTFDFGSPAPPLTIPEQSFFERYRDAVNARDESALVALEDPSVKSCKFEGREFLIRNFRYTVPADAKVRLFPIHEDLAKAAGMGSIAYMPVIPTAVLAISYHNSTTNHVSSVSIMQAIRETGDSITVVPYCLTDKGEQMRKDKTQSGK
jgi:hypothetical protein